MESLGDNDKKLAQRGLCRLVWDGEKEFVLSL